MSLQDELKDKTKGLSKVCQEVAKYGKRKLNEMKSKVDKLEIENEKLIMKLEDIESDERFKRVDANGGLSLTYKKLLQRLFMIGLSVEQVKANKKLLER